MEQSVTIAKRKITLRRYANPRKSEKIVESSDSESSDDEFIIKCIQYNQSDKTISAVNGKSRREWSHDLLVNKQMIQFKLDTGAECNVISKSALKSMNPSPKLKKTTAKLSAYNESVIPVCGKTILKVTHIKVKHNVLFIAVDAELPAILGLNTIEHLDLIRRVNEIKLRFKEKEFTDLRRDLDMVCCAARKETIHKIYEINGDDLMKDCLLYTSPSPRDLSTSRMPSSA